MPKEQRTVLIIDGLSTGALLAPYLNQKGIKCYHMHSNDKPPQCLESTFDSNNFIADYKPKNYQEALNIARALKVSAVIPGAETGTILSALLNNDLRIQVKSDQQLIQALRDKFLMTEIIKSKKVPAALQIQVTTMEQIRNWIQSNRLENKKIVLKPVMSAAADSVFFCNTDQEIQNAFNNIMQNLNVYGARNDSVLVQEFLEGIEYVVNTVSCQGVHKITDIWQYKKIDTQDGRRLYGQTILMHPEGEIQNQLIQYVKQVLDALEVQLGFAHVEIMMTPTQGPILVEIGNRMMGGNHAGLATDALGQGQLECGVAAFLYPDQFSQIPDVYKWKNINALSLKINCQIDNVLFDARILNRVENLKSFVRQSYHYNDGDQVHRSVDFATIVGSIQLLNQDNVQLEADINQILEWERNGSFFKKSEH